MPTLNWIGKDKVINHHLDVPYRVLNKEYTFNAEDSENKIIHGDNLEALKALLPEYEGKIKCIYIDPPYNTGNEGWVYNDNVNDPKIKKWLGEIVGKESDDLTRHDKWLCMMYPRLKLLQKLLDPNGSLVISISYHEVFNLIHLLKEIFSKKQIECITVQTSGGKPSGAFNYQHEYLIFVLPLNFEANPMSFTGGKTRSPFEGLTLATFDKTQRPNQTYPIFVSKTTGNIVSVGKSLYERLKDNTYVGNLDNFIYDYNEAPEGTVAIWPYTSKGKECVWRLTSNRLIDDWNKGYIKVIKNNNSTIKNDFSIQYLPEGIIKKIESGKLEILGYSENCPTLIFGENKTVGNDIPTLWLEKDFYSVKGTTLLNDIFLQKKFDYPKPLNLITEILSALTNEEDLILDSFAGSGSTAHAVLNLNKEDGGNRKFILVEMEDYAENITAERVKRVINGYGEDKKKVDGTGGDFNYYELGLPIFKEEFLNEELSIEEIRKYIWYSETKEKYVQQDFENPYLVGINNEASYYFLYEKDKLTTLNMDFLNSITIKSSTYVIYADNCVLPKEFLTKNNIIFKKTPRDISRF